MAGVGGYLEAKSPTLIKTKHFMISAVGGYSYVQDQSKHQATLFEARRFNRG